MKPRIIGAAIIVVVATVVLPLLFQNPIKYPDIPDFVIPPEPAMRELSFVKPPEHYAGLKARLDNGSPRDTLVPNQVPHELTNAASAKTNGASSANQDNNATQTSQRKSFKLGDSGLPDAWSVRLATFKEYPNAAALRDKLRKAGYKVYTKQVRSAKSDLVQVLVGPKRTNDSAKK